MALTIVNVNVSTTSTVTIGSHSVGDTIIIFAYRDGLATLPSLPAAGGTVPAWVDIDANTGANTNSARTAFFEAVTTTTTSGTWTNATGMIAVVLRGDRRVVIGGHAESGSAATGPAGFVSPALSSQSNISGSSQLLYFYGARNVTAWDAAPSGYTRQASNATEVALNTKDDTTSDGSATQTATTSISGGYRSAVIEVFDEQVNPFITGTSTAITTSVTIPIHRVGDLIVIYAFDDGFVTAPAQPAASGTVPAWAAIDNAAGASSCASGTFYFVATATNHTSGTWSNTSAMIATVIRNQNITSPIGGHAESGGTATNGATAPSITMSQTSGTSILLHLFGRRGNVGISAWSAAPAGYTSLAASVPSHPISAITKNDTTSDGSVTRASDENFNIGYRGATVEILAAPPQGNFFPLIMA